MKIGILRETRRWDDRRAAITPTSARKIKKLWPYVELFVQPSKTRAFSVKEYEKAGVNVKEDLSDCDILVGVKEVAEETLIEGKTYIMFAHVAKMQEHNQPFFKTLSEKKITLIDYEYLTNNKGTRLIAFGYWAGVVGAYYAIGGILKRFLGIEPPDFFTHNNPEDLLKKIEIPPLKIVITGDGRVRRGVSNILKKINVKQVNPDEFLNNQYSEAVFCILSSNVYVKPKKGIKKTAANFFNSPGDFESAFLPYTKVADVYIPCHFWHPESPVFFTGQDVASNDFNIRLVADISCDVPDPVPTTIRTSEHDSPFYDVNRKSMLEFPAFSNDDNVTVIAVDNLPTALPRDSSESFAEALVKHIIPSFFNGDEEGIIKRATILKAGELTSAFSYLSDFLNK